jgi:glycosyltransferase involved in cell wall biosynthesis
VPSWFAVGSNTERDATDGNDPLRRNSAFVEVQTHSEVAQSAILKEGERMSNLGSLARKTSRSAGRPVSVANAKIDSAGMISSSAGSCVARTRPLRIVSIFNRYVFRGGEEEVFEAEAKMLTARDCQVTAVSVQTVPPEGTFAKLAFGLQATWSGSWHKKIRNLLLQERPDVVHVHNSFPMISPSIYYACRESGVPVVQTLHNYRLLCPGALFYRDGKVCEDCLEGGLRNSVRHGCYRGSSAQTAAVALMLGTHRALDTWDEKVDGYIALTEFARQKFIQGGLPAERIAVKPNFLDPDPGPRQGPGEGAVFVGRLSEQKGLLTLLEAWRRVPREFSLRIIGEGPLLDELQARKKGWTLTNVKIEGHLPREGAIAAIRRAQFLIFPSLWYECFPLTLVEAFACGVPVIASQLGAMAELVDDGRTGMLFRAGESMDLAERIAWARCHARETDAMARACREEFLAKYTADKNFDQLMAIYNKVMDRKLEAIA